VEELAGQLGRRLPLVGREDLDQVHRRCRLAGASGDQPENRQDGEEPGPNALAARPAAHHAPLAVRAEAEPAIRWAAGESYVMPTRVSPWKWMLVTLARAHCRRR